MSVLSKIMRAGEGKILRKLHRIADQVNSIEEDFEGLSDAELRALTDEYKQRYADGESLDDLLPEAFATVREAARRVLGQRHYDVQIMGGAALHMGYVAEMKTGEGKTLVGTLPAYLNALSGEGVHIITVNDYLAERDSEMMGRVHRFLGLSVGCILASMTPAQRREQYGCDITYGTNNEFGFDYLRDNMAWSKDELVQRGHNFAIVDEVDSILIDEARTPLIISGPADQATKWYGDFAKLVKRLKRGEPGNPLKGLEETGDYDVDEKKRTVAIHESGVAKVEDWLGIDNLYESVNTPLVGYLNNAIKAKELFKRDKDYVIIDDEVMIVDEHTGRILAGRRYNEGMHQAIEAKEGVAIKDENQTLATITLQNFFRLYKRHDHDGKEMPGLSGMTGTAMTEAAEFHQIYKLGVVPIPTNRPMVRKDQSDLIYRTEVAKFEAVVDDIEEKHRKGQPILVGTTSVEKSEYLSQQLSKRGIQHEVLNAKQHDREAQIVAQAGRRGAVTVATNMAGRGTDIKLGGNPEDLAEAELRQRGLDPEEHIEEWAAALPAALERAEQAVKAELEEVEELGGLYVLGTERHESRRIDNQLRGRSGRQGDPGESPLLPVPGRRPDAAVQGADGRARDVHGERAGRRADREQDGHPRDRVRAVAGGDAELRDAQERPEVRRGAEPAARGHLRRAPPRPGGRGPPGADPALHGRHDRRLRPGGDRRGLPRGLGPGPAVGRVQAAVPGEGHRRGAGGGGRRPCGPDRRVHRRVDQGRHPRAVRGARDAARLRDHA
ncbi:Protein translocase subunit SecA [Streptomyces tendae]